MKNEKLTFEFETPEHGWLPVKIAFKDFCLEFETSDVPANPIDALISSLRSVLKGIEAEVWWHLEPAYYCFKFERFGEEYKIYIYFADSENSNKKKVCELPGNFKSLILPIYRAIKKFITQSHDALNWPATDGIAIERLVGLVKEIKTSPNQT